MNDGRLYAESHEQTVQEAARAFSVGTSKLDVLVVGGGVTGAGIAVDAATRGLVTCLVEADDWASGTSSRSSKLVHGGLRYLRTLDFALIREALLERNLLATKLAPHLVAPQQFVFPLKRWQRPVIGAGVMLYEVLGSGKTRTPSLPRHRHIGKGRLRQVFAALNPKLYQGAITYWDATVDDARLVLSLMRTARAAGAHVLSRVKVVRLLDDGKGRVCGAAVVDLESGEEFEIEAKSVIVATGVWTEKTQTMAPGSGGLRVLASKGVHIVVPRDAIPGNAAVVAPTKSSVLFLIPWEDHWLIGTTDTPWQLDVSIPLATASDVEYLLEQTNAILTKPITREQVVGVFAGLRPLLQKGVKPGTRTTKVSREHTVASPAPGLTAIAGGKLTTYRLMARDAVDHALGERAAALPSVTHMTPIAGAAHFEEVKQESSTWPERFGWDDATVAHLLRRFGDNAREIVEICEKDEANAKPLTEAPEYLRAEIVHAVTHEGALHVDDILARRTHIAFQVTHRGVDAVQEVASIVAPLLGWDDDRRDREVREYATLASAEMRASELHDDRDATRAFLEHLGRDAAYVGAAGRASISWNDRNAHQ
ncbi:MAG: glycerol-3-phosphate dehydrogenase/oxidase [Acidimicrobiia bacterium]